MKKESKFITVNIIGRQDDIELNPDKIIYYEKYRYEQNNSTEYGTRIVCDGGFEIVVIESTTVIDGRLGKYYDY